MKKYKIREGSPIWWAKYIGMLLFTFGSMFTTVALLALLSY